MIFCRSYYYFRPSKERNGRNCSRQKWGEINWEIGKWLTRFCFQRVKGQTKLMLWMRVKAMKQKETEPEEETPLSPAVCAESKKTYFAFWWLIKRLVFLGHFRRDFVHTKNTALSRFWLVLFFLTVLFWRFLANKKQLNLVYFGLKIPFLNMIKCNAVFKADFCSFRRCI